MSDFETVVAWNMAGFSFRSSLVKKMSYEIIKELELHRTMKRHLHVNMGVKNQNLSA